MVRQAGVLASLIAPAFAITAQKVALAAPVCVPRRKFASGPGCIRVSWPAILIMIEASRSLGLFSSAVVLSAIRHLVVEDCGPAGERALLAPQHSRVLPLGVGCRARAQLLVARCLPD